VDAERPDPSTVAWFARAGQPWSAAESAAVEELIASWPALDGATTAAVASADAASALLRTAVFDDAWWDEEEGLREGLWHAATHALSDAELERRLAEAGARWRQVAHDAARRAFAADSALAHDAAAALALAAHQRMLAQLAGEGGRHVFARKLALFAAGRWPLGYHRGRYYVF
jgi:hypothetical protein